MSPETRLARVLTRYLAVAHIAFAVAWLSPLHGVELPGRVNVAVSIASYAPVWAILFGATGGLLVFAQRWCPAGRWGHAIGAVVTLAFGAASVSSAVFSEPLGSVLPGVAFAVLAAVHSALQRYYERRRA